MLALAVTAALLAAPASWSQNPDLSVDLGIDHRYSNSDAQSLIGLPMGSHKTTVEKDGSLRWSQWSLKRKPLDVPIGFSSQMDGALEIEPFADGTDLDHPHSTPLIPKSQTLYQGRYPFIVTQLSGGGLEIEELAFSVDPEQDPAQFPTAMSGLHGLDMIRIKVHNASNNALHFRAWISPGVHGTYPAMWMARPLSPTAEN